MGREEKSRNCSLALHKNASASGKGLMGVSPTEAEQGCAIFNIGFICAIQPDVVGCPDWVCTSAALLLPSQIVSEVRGQVADWACAEGLWIGFGWASQICRVFDCLRQQMRVVFGM